MGLTGSRENVEKEHVFDSFRPSSISSLAENKTEEAKETESLPFPCLLVASLRTEEKTFLVPSSTRLEGIIWDSSVLSPHKIVEGRSSLSPSSIMKARMAKQKDEKVFIFGLDICI